MFAVLWQKLSGSLWLVPGAIALAAIALGAAMVELSGLLDQRVLARFPRIFGADAESSRSALATIAGSIITVAGVTFSITVVVLSQAATQYTPRVLRNFMRDRPSQVSLGILVGVFLYCLLVIRTIRADGGAAFVPSLAVILAFVLAVLAIAVLVYFIHHIASALEAGKIIARISRETVAVIDRLFPEPAGEMDDERAPECTARPERESTFMCAPRTGYIQAFDPDRLLRLAEAHGVVMCLQRRPGDFVAEGEPLVEILSEASAKPMVQKVCHAVSIDTYRTVLQDPGFGIRQIADIALKALSPAMNDATTAVTCLDYLQVILSRLASRRIAPRATSEEGAARLITQGPTFECLLAEALEEILLAAANNPRVLRRMVNVIEAVGADAQPPRRRLLLQHLDSILQTAQNLKRREDLERVCEACREVQNAWREYP